MKSRPARADRGMKKAEERKRYNGVRRGLRETWHISRINADYLSL